MNQEVDLNNINIKALWKILKKEKWIIIGITSLFTVSGGLYSYSLKEEFRSEGKILPEIQSKSGSIGQFAGLAALAGVDIAAATSGSDAVRPDLYPDVVRSTPFFLELFKSKFKNKSGKEIVFQDFYNRVVLNGKNKLEDQKSKYSESENYITLSLQSEKNIKDLKKRIICIYEKKTGIISISVKLPDPVLAADVTHFTLKYLTQYIINYRTEKESRDLIFLEDRLRTARGKYYNSQNRKAEYSDQMPLEYLKNQSIDVQRERIESDYKISSTFYNSLLQKYEEAKLKKQQITPIIKILDPPVVSNIKVEPNRSMIIIGFTFFGIILGIIISVLRKNNYKKIAFYG